MLFLVFCFWLLFFPAGEKTPASNSGCCLVCWLVCWFVVSFGWLVAWWVDLNDRRPRRIDGLMD